MVSRFWPDHGGNVECVKLCFLEPNSKVKGYGSQGTGATEMTSMSNKPRGLPLSKTHIEKIFPKLTSAQISRIAGRGGHMLIIHYSFEPDELSYTGS